MSLINVEIYDNNQISVDVPYASKELVKAIPGSRWSNVHRMWTVPLSWTACLQLRSVFGDQLNAGPKLHDWIWEEHQTRIVPSMKLRSQLTPELNLAVNDNAYPFQKADVDFLHVAGNALIGNVLGTGKTISALTALASLKDTLPALVICPNSVKAGWAKQAVTWLPKASVYNLSGSTLARRKILAEAKNDPNALVIINIEAVRLMSRVSGFGSINLVKCRECDPKNGDPNLGISKCQVHRKELNGFGFKTVIIDEAHKIKEPKSQQTRACWSVAHDPTVTRRWAMTGTPIANSVEDLWSIMHAIAPEEWPTKSKFIEKYALTAWNAFGGISVVGINPHHREEFFNILNPRFRRVLKEEVLEQIPNKVRSVRFVQMDTKQLKAYKQMSDLLTAQVDDGVLSVQNSLTKSTRLLQLASSYAKIDIQEDGEIKVVLAEPSSKLDAMEDILDELGPERRVVIAAQSKQLIMLAAARFKNNRVGESFGLIAGDQSEWEREQAIEQLKAGNHRAVLMTIQAGGTGVDGLQCADTMIVLQRSWSMIDNVQLEGRIDRIGQQSNNVHIIDIIAENSIEGSTLWPRLRDKFERLEEITNDRAKLTASGHSDFSAFDLEEMQIYNSVLL